MLKALKDLFYRKKQEKKESFAAGPDPEGRALDFSGLVTLGRNAIGRGDFSQAADYFVRAVSIDPNDVDLRVSLGFVLIQRRRLADARVHLNRAILIASGNANAFYLLGRVAHMQGDLAAAVENFSEALQIQPDFEAVFGDWATACMQLGRVPEAKSILADAISKFPGSADFHYRLGSIHAQLQELELALPCYQRALAINPRFPEAHHYLGQALAQMGDVEGAIQRVRQALVYRPGDVPATSSLLWLLSFQPGGGAGHYLPEARRYGATVFARATPYRAWARPPATGLRPLRVGLVSGDFRVHPVGFFLDGVLASLSRRTLELYAYSMNRRDDALTDTLRPYFAQWTPIAHLNDEETAGKIHQDQIDILIDLAGHSAYNRLPVFAWKPAPVQLSWLGYLASTGVPGIDYAIADPIAAPKTVQEQFSEELWYLPETIYCFTPPAEQQAPEVVSPPSKRNGYVTFGSFQRMHKVNDATLTLWGRVLKALPDARLCLRNGGLHAQTERDHFTTRLAQLGIAPERVTLADAVARVAYFAAHGEVDIILDTFPHPGATTTCEALWMGVPTLTLAGDTMLSRIGASLLTCAGLSDWVANNEEEFVTLAVRHASDIEGLARQRAGLRRQVASTTLFDSARFAPQFEAALFAMWKRKMKELEPAAGGHRRGSDLNEIGPLIPDTQADSWYQTGKIALEKNNYALAIEHFNRALTANPAFELALRDLGRALFQSGQPAAAKLVVLQGVERFPQSADFHYYLGNVYEAEKQYQLAIGAWNEALRYEPDYAQVHFNIGRTLIKARCSEQALPSLDRALALDPEHLDAHNNRGNALLALNRFEEALESYQNTLRIDPANTDALLNTGCVQIGLGQMDLAMASFRHALAIKPDYFAAHSSLLWCLSFAAEQPAKAYVAEARAYGARVAAQATPYSRWLIDSATPLHRPLKVGLVSGDLRAHPVGYFLSGVLAKLNPAKVDLVAYSENPYDDGLTEHFKSICSVWTSILGVSDQEVASKIHADGVDVLIDLAGHSGHTRLPVFAWKPAPVQVTWLGYLASTGVPGIDYVLADAIAAPLALRDQFTEEIWHLPDTFNCFTPPDAHPALVVAPTPALRNGYITFGSFQRLNKITDATLTLWARILKAMPQARLRLQNVQTSNHQAKTALQGRLADFDLPLERCILTGPIEGRENHLAAHAEVDIVLDTSPYPGITTTSEALWMGVPTLTLGGATMLGRAGASLLTCAGLKEWVAWSDDAYLALAIRHGSDIAELSRLRAGLRQQVAKTPLFDAAQFAIQLENALLAMWNRKVQAELASTK